MRERKSSLSPPLPPFYGSLAKAQRLADVDFGPRNNVVGQRGAFQHLHPQLGILYLQLRQLAPCTHTRLSEVLPLKERENRTLYVAHNAGPTNEEAPKDASLLGRGRKPTPLYCSRELGKKDPGAALARGVLVRWPGFPSLPPPGKPLGVSYEIWMFPSRLLSQRHSALPNGD